MAERIARDYDELGSDPDAFARRQEQLENRSTASQASPARAPAAGSAVAPRNTGGLVPTFKGNIPQADKWIRNGGRVVCHTDGGITYIKNGVSIRYNSVGYPDFSKHLYKGGDGLSQVRINLTGTRRGDFAAANEAAGFASTPKGYTWHHHEDVGLMQLVNTRVHSEFWHSGGFSLGQ